MNHMDQSQNKKQSRTQALNSREVRLERKLLDEAMIKQARLHYHCSYLNSRCWRPAKFWTLGILNRSLLLVLLPPRRPPPSSSPFPTPSAIRPSSSSSLHSSPPLRPPSPNSSSLPSSSHCALQNSLPTCNIACEAAMQVDIFVC